jgi:WD40 repeat protein
MSTLRDLGGAQDIVRQHLDRVMRGFSPPEMVVLADAFGHLVTPSGSKIAHRPSDLAEFSGHDPEQVATLLHRLAEGDQRILRDVPPPLDEPHAEPRYEIFHDVLALAVLDWRRRFLAEAESRRQQAELVAEKERVEQETRATRSRLRKARTLIVAMALLLVACVVLAGWAVQQRNSAQDARDDAVAAEHRAEQAELDARVNEARSQLDTDPSGALRNLVQVAEDSGGSPPADLEALLRQAVDAADTDVELNLGSSVVFAGFAGPDRLVAVTESGLVRAWDVTSQAPVRLDEDLRLEVAVTEENEEETERVVQAATAADNTFLVVLSDAGVVSAVDLESGDVRRLDQTFGQGARLDVPDGPRDRVVLSDFDRNLVVWDVAADRVVPSPSPGERLDGAALDPTGQTLALVSGLQVDVYDLDTLRRVASRTFDSHLEPAQVPQSAFVAFTGRPGVVLVLVFGSRIEMSRWVLDGDEVVPLGDNLWWKQVVDVSDVNLGGFDYLAVAGDKTATLFDDDGAFRAQTNFANDFVSGVQTSPVDSSVWALSTAEGYTGLYRTNIAPPKPFWTFRGQVGPITSLDFSPDGAAVVTGSTNGTVRVWRAPDSTMEWYIPDRIINVAYTPDGRFLFGFTPAGSVVRESRTPEVATEYAPLFGQAVGTAASPDGLRAVVTDSYCTVPVQVSFATKKAPVATLVAPEQSACPTVIAWNPDPTRRQIVAGTYENRLVAWDADSGAVTGELALGPDTSEVHSIAMSGDGSTVVAGSGTGAKGEIHVVRTDDLTEVGTWATSAVDSLAVSADGRYVVAAGNEEHEVTVWDAEEGRQLQSLDDATGSLNDVSISQDDDASLVSVSTSSGLVYVWDRESGQLMAVTRRHADSANQAAFDPQDADRMVSGGDDGVVYSYTCDVCSIGPEELQEAAEARLSQVIDLTE